MQEGMEADAAGWRGDFKNAYEAHAKKLGIRQSVLKDEFRRALAIKRQIEKEKAYDPIEREQRETLRAATSGMSLAGTPMGDWFMGKLATPEDGDGDDGVEEDRDQDSDDIEEIGEPDPAQPSARRELAVS